MKKLDSITPKADLKREQPKFNLLDFFAPNFSLKREQQKFNLQKFRAFAAGEITRFDRKIARNSAIDDDVRKSALMLRAKARELEQNYDIARGTLNVLVAKVIGTGIHNEPQIKTSTGELHVAANKTLLKYWREWSDKPEVTKQYTYSTLQQMAFRALCRDGEIFMQRLSGNITTLDHATIVPYSVELIDADFVPMDINNIIAPNTSNQIVQGIEKNAWNEEIAFWIYKQNPLTTFQVGVVGVGNADLKRVGKDKIIHAKLTDRINQTRGVTLFASILNRFRDIQDYEESERIAARVAAAFCMYLKKPDLESFQPDHAKERYIDAAPGRVITDLLPGEEIGEINPDRPNPNLEKFRNGQLKAVASGIGANYSSISQNYEGSYSSQRQEVVDSKASYDGLRDYFINSCLKVIWKDFVTMAVTKGLVPLQGVDEITLYDCDFKHRAQPWIDPLKEAKAQIEMVQAGFKTRAQVIRELGGNPSEVYEALKIENAEDKENELKFTTTMNEQEIINQAPSSANNKEPAPSAEEE